MFKRSAESLRRMASVIERQARTLDKWAVKRREEGNYASAARREAFDFRREARGLLSKANRQEGDDE